MHPQIAWPSLERQARFESWLAGVAPGHGLDTATLSPASSDASFRRYLRVQGRHGSLIVMCGQSQARWKHQLPKMARVHSPRVNLTFRRILSS